MRHQPRQEIGRRDEIGVEKRDELAARDLETGLERARLVTRPVGAVEVLDVDALGREPPDRSFGDAPCLVSRVVEHLNLEKLRRILDSAHRLDQPVGDVHLVVQRQLNGDDRQRREGRARLRLLIAVPHVEIHEVIAMPAVNCEDNQDEEVSDERKSFSKSHYARRIQPSR